jgi:hypothetical protein
LLDHHQFDLRLLVGNRKQHGRVPGQQQGEGKKAGVQQH